MGQDKRWYAIIAIVLMVGLATVACGSLGGEETPTATPTLPRPPDGRCGDGVCDGPENAQNCPQDCAPTAAPPTDTPVPPTAAPKGPCGDGVCDQTEKANPALCPQDCASPTAPTALPLYVTIYYHVEPNPQLFETVEPGYFEAVSLSLRDMSSSLASINVHATFCFAWLYNDLAHCRNCNPQTGEIINSPADTSIETYEQILVDGHELAYHTHPPMAIVEGNAVYYARPNSTCDGFSSERHRWSGLNADAHYDFFPGVYQFDDPADPWYGQFTWERTTESLFLIADYLGATIRHPNGGQRPLLDITNKYGSGINHEHGIQQIRSLMELGFDLLAPEVMPFFSSEYAATGPFWADPSTGYVAYFGPDANIQAYYPDIDGGHIENAVTTSQGLTFMPVQKAPQAGWGKGVPDDNYYDERLLGGTGGGGVRWTDDTFYASYSGRIPDPWTGAPVTISFPSLAEQFNNAMQRHLTETPASVNAWGFNHHVVNVMWADLSGLSDNWDGAIFFMRDIADGVADGVANEPHADLVQFVTMQELSDAYDAVVASATR